MPVTAQKLTDENIIVVSYESPYRVEDTIESVETIHQIVEEATDVIYLIVDLTRLNMGFSDMVQGLAASTSGKQGWSLKDPRTRLVVVGANKLIEFGVKAVNQTQYGGVNIPLFDTLDEALTYVRKQVTA
ncbi:MAG: hypothetical protein K8I82_28545 [Anaerolineae bacterium]|nr:hypothetical protein [Anaerolineae bacterium]